MNFHIKNKIITLDENTLPPDGVVGDNTDYTANFFFDDGWLGVEKTARFIGKNGHKDVILENDSCKIPREALKSGLLLVGVYAGDLQTTTPARVPIRASILDKDGLPADPTPDVYAQLLKRLDALYESSGSSVTIKNWTEEDLEGAEE